MHPKPESFTSLSTLHIVESIQQKFDNGFLSDLSLEVDISCNCHFGTGERGEAKLPEVIREGRLPKSDLPYNYLVRDRQ